MLNLQKKVGYVELKCERQYFLPASSLMRNLKFEAFWIYLVTQLVLSTVYITETPNIESLSSTNIGNI